MTPLTLSAFHHRSPGATVAASNVFLIGHCLKMCGVNAASLTANMVDHETIWYFPLVVLIRKPVCSYPSASMKGLPVATASLLPKP
jgi:hypothetical protein